MDKIIQILAKEFNIKIKQIKDTIELIDKGNTIPFIARYRKEATGGLDDVILRKLDERLAYLRNLEGRKEEITRLINEQGKLSPELKNKIEAASVLQEVEDLYLPFRPKRRTRATIAKERGLEPLALLIFNQGTSQKEIDIEALKFINNENGLESVEVVIKGAKDIIAEIISENADFRKRIREITFRDGQIISSVIKNKKNEKSEFEMYYDFTERISKIANHRVLAINRGEKKKFLSIKIEAPEEKIINYLNKQNLKEFSNEYVIESIKDAYKRLIAPSIEREIRSQLTERADEQAIKVFSTNLKNLLFQPPVNGKVTMGFDPAYRTGCKIAVVDGYGNLLDTTTVYPTPPLNKIESAEMELLTLINKFNIELISIGNGTASRESELFVGEIIKKCNQKVQYIVVNEAGASVYSASKLANEEYPDINVSLRGAISIARRLQDPLAELVKIDPKHIGVGQYQHDVNQKKLEKALEGVVEDAVNSVGVDINTASVSLLKNISGINKTIAKNIVIYKQENGPFLDRKELLKVKKLGEKAFVQCAGFLRIPDGKNMLDNTAVHPESYDITKKLIEKIGMSLDNLESKNSLEDIGKQLCNIDLKKIAEELEIGMPTLEDIVKELQKPGRDPRDEMPKPIFKSDVMEMEDLKPGMILTGTVRNVIDFGAFVDIGVHQDGLVHISQLSEKYVKNPMDVVAIGDIVKVKVLEVDIERKRISLTMKEI